jgi:tryptophan 2,3-dioxygenase
MYSKKMSAVQGYSDFLQVFGQASSFKTRTERSIETHLVDERAERLEQNHRVILLTSTSEGALLSTTTRSRPEPNMRRELDGCIERRLIGAAHHAQCSRCCSNGNQDLVTGSVHQVRLNQRHEESIFNKKNVNSAELVILTDDEERNKDGFVRL